MSVFEISSHGLLAGVEVDTSPSYPSSFEVLKNENKEYIVQGPEGYTADEAAKVFIDTYTGTKLTISRAPLAVLKFVGLFSNTVNYGHHIIEALNNYPEKFEAEETWNTLGRPATTLADYARAVN